ncbi:MAG: ketoacyl-ACP synthase III [Selenomonadaceae bacterium]|nr:ketoacyl-ACP synthase III [Selenomonadaceae bacterium]
MKFNFKNKKISGILTVIPKNEVSFDDYADKFQSTPKQMKRLKEVMGFDKRRVAKKGTNFSDLAVFGVEKLLSESLIKKEEIGALILITQSPDYFLPPTTNVIQGRLNLPTDVYCLDMNNGCAGYIVGLVQAFQLLEHMTDKKILLFVGESIGERTSDKQNINSTNRDTLLWGDAVAISIVENDFNENSTHIFSEILMDGNRCNVIRCPSKSFMELCSTLDYIETSFLSERVMNGGEVFRFTQVDVPPVIERLLKDSGKTKEEIDWFLFHQPNKFMVENLAEILKIPSEKTPSNVVAKFGNAESATIPTNICLNLTPDILHKTFSVCLSGFGTGLTVGAMTMQLGPLNFCEFAEY